MLHLLYPYLIFFLFCIEDKNNKLSITHNKKKSVSKLYNIYLKKISRTQLTTSLLQIKLYLNGLFQKYSCIIKVLFFNY